MSGANRPFGERRDPNTRALRLPSQTWQVLEGIATREGTSTHEIVRRIIYVYLDQEELDILRAHRFAELERRLTKLEEKHVKLVGWFRRFIWRRVKRARAARQLRKEGAQGWNSNAGSSPPPASSG